MQRHIYLQVQEKKMSTTLKYFNLNSRYENAYANKFCWNSYNFSLIYVFPFPCITNSQEGSGLHLSTHAHHSMNIYLSKISLLNSKIHTKLMIIHCKEKKA